MASNFTHTSPIGLIIIGLQFVHCIGTSRWLLLPTGNSHIGYLTLDLIGLEPSSQINGLTEMPTVSYWVTHSLDSKINCWLILTLNLVQKVNYNVPTNQQTCLLHLQIGCLNKLQDFGSANQLIEASTSDIQSNRRRTDPNTCVHLQRNCYYNISCWKFGNYKSIQKSDIIIEVVFTIVPYFYEGTRMLLVLTKILLINIHNMYEDMINGTLIV